MSSFEYLGILITNDGKIESGIASRAKKANMTYSALNRIIRRRQGIEKKLNYKYTAPYLYQQLLAEVKQK